MKERPRNILIIGAGASGMCAAYAAAGAGADVTVLEHMNEAGKKLLVTGRGRCNFTNTDISEAHYHCSKPGFVSSVLDGFGPQECIQFFASIGVAHQIRHYDFDDNGYIYPLSEDAKEVRNALYNATLELGVKYHFREDAVYLPDPFDNVFGRFDALLLAAGGNSYPRTGSDSSIYPLIKRIGLPFSTFRPALCGLYSKDEALKELKGQRIRAFVDLMVDDEVISSRYGEIQFLAHSISGIPVMDHSSLAGEAIDKGKKVELMIKGHMFLIYRTAGFDHSQVSRGGLNIDYFDPHTLMSKVRKDVYAAGELLDVDGECGGYNLHFAFASGLRAGRSAALG